MKHSFRVYGRVLLENYEGLSIKEKFPLTDTLWAVSRVWESCYEDFGEKQTCVWITSIISLPYPYLQEHAWGKAEGKMEYTSTPIYVGPGHCG